IRARSSSCWPARRSCCRSSSATPSTSTGCSGAKPGPASTSTEPERKLAAGNGNEEGFAHHVLAGEHLLRAAALRVEDHRRELMQRRARFVDGAAVGIYSGQFLDEADVAVAGLEIHRSEGELSLFHVTSCTQTCRVRGLPYKSVSAPKKISRVKLRELLSSHRGDKILRRANYRAAFAAVRFILFTFPEILSCLSPSPIDRRREGATCAR